MILIFSFLRMYFLVLDENFLATPQLKVLCILDIFYLRTFDNHSNVDAFDVRLST